MGRSRGPPSGPSGNDAKDLGASRSKRKKPESGPESWEFPSPGEDTRKGLYHCNYCQRDISMLVRLKCAQCIDFDLCVECFSVGVEVYPHKADHSYHVMENLSFPLFDADWNADEESLLLEGVEVFGIGNWGSVADHIGTKDKSQCSHHYKSAYLLSPVAPLPDMSRISGMAREDLKAMAAPTRVGKVDFSVLNPGLKKEPFLSPTPGIGSIKTEDGEPVAMDQDASGVTGSRGEPPPHQGTESSHEQAKKKSAAQAGKAKREGTEGDAQVSQRPFGSTMAMPKPSVGTGGSDVEKKGGTVAGVEHTPYHVKRDEFDPEYDNDAEVPLSELEFSEADTATDRALKLQMLQIYNCRLDERQRRHKFILERGLLSVAKRQALDRKRSKEERELYLRGRVFARFQGQEEHEKLMDGIVAGRRIQKAIEELQEYRAAGCRTLAEGERYELEKRKRGMEQAMRRSMDGLAMAGSSKGMQRSVRGLEREPGDADLPHPEAATDPPDSARPPLQGNGHSQMQSKVAIRRLTGSVNLDGYPGAELLTHKELEICSQLRILPVHFLKIKEVLICECVANGGLSKERARTFFKFSSSKIDFIYGFFASKGWLRDVQPNDVMSATGSRRG